MARLLGIRLLMLDATVVIVPADVTARSPALHDSQTRTPARPASLPPTRSGAVGGGLAEAVRRIDEGAALLAEARRTAPASRVEREAGARR